MPFTGLAAVLTVLGVLGFAPAIAAATPAGGGNTARDQEWWLADLNVTQAWQKSEGAGITVAVLGTGVDASYPGLAGSVITGPDYTDSGRAPGSPYWGVEGTAVAGIIAAHQSGSGLAGVAPAARILSVRVTLEFNDPLATNPAVSQRLPDAIANGIRYAADRGARIIDLPLDPGTLGLTSTGDPAAAGGSPAEQAAVAYALSKGVVLVAPAGDDGQGPGIVNYPAAYPGVIAVGATGRTGQLASFSSKRPYASLTAPGVSLITAAPPDGYGTISSTSTASGIVAGVAALILSRFPQLTATQVTRALIESTVPATAGSGLPPLPARSSAGAGYGTVDALRAVDMAALIVSASQPHQSAPVVPHQPARHPVASPHRPAASTLARSVLRDAVAAVCVLIVLLVVALVAVRSRRNRDRGPVRGGAGDRARPGGQHQHRRSDRGRTGPARDVTAANGTMPSRRPPDTRTNPAQPAAWASPAGWQGGGLSEIRPAAEVPSRPAAAAAPKSTSGYRADRGAGRTDGNSGPPWEPAPPPQRLIGPLPVSSAGPPPPQPGRGIRLPGDMAAPSGAATDPSPPVSFDLTTPPVGFDLSTPAFGLTPHAFDEAPPASNGAPPASNEPAPGFDGPPPVSNGIPPVSNEPPPASNEAPPRLDGAPPAFNGAPPASNGAPPGSDATTVAAAEVLPTRPGPTRQGLGFAAAPVPADYAAAPAELAPNGDREPAQAADPSYIWDLAATDVFPAAPKDATGAAVPKDDGAGADES
jgi:serine protease